MSALTDALARRPEGLGERHTALARLLLGRDEGVTRQQGARALGVSDRIFRQLVEDVITSRWLPVLADRANGEAHYRIARAHEAQRAADEAAELQARALSLHRRAKGLTEAFRAHHSAGALFLPDVPDLEEAV